MEYVLKTAMVVAVVFVVSDFDDLQQYLVVGSQVCILCMIHAEVLLSQ